MTPDYYPTWLRRTDVLIAIAFICVISMIIIPLPPILLDFLICINLVLGATMLLSVMYILKPIEFSIFPALLLMATVYRLALEVSTARLILLGRGQEIGVVRTFGNFVVGGDYVVGIIIFIIITIVLLLVIIRGANRVSEVAARFTLDAMPGKQMAIDADLNAGIITEEEATRRREEIRREGDFYGAMDGAVKFVQGDAIACLIIAAINIIGGLTLGVVRDGLSIAAAAKTYILLSIGAALSAQLPALLIAIATGLIVSRAAGKQELGLDIGRQLTQQPKTLWIVAGFILLLALLPSFPKLPLLLVGAGLCGIAYIMRRVIKEEAIAEEEEKRKEEVKRLRSPESVASLLSVEPMEIEVGYSLVPLVLPEKGGDLLDRITMQRRQFAQELGIIVPPIRIRDNIQLKSNEYVFKIRGVEVARGSIRVGKYLAMRERPDVKELPGELVKEPAFGMPAIWIDDKNRKLAEELGYTVIDVSTFIMTHLGETIKKNIESLLGRQEVQTLLDSIKQNYPVLISELIPNVLSLGEVQKVLHALLKEGISIRDLVSILEALADWAPVSKDINFLVEKVRKNLARQISQKYLENNTLYVITVDAKLEEELSKAVDKEGRITISPNRIQQILSQLKEAIIKLKEHKAIIILCAARIRTILKTLIGAYMPQIVVLSYDEIAEGVNVQGVAMLK